MFNGNYTPPATPEEAEDEARFLAVLEALLKSTAFNALTVPDIAKAAGSDKTTFIRRFGSKRNALDILFERFCDEVRTELAAIHSMSDTHSLQKLCFEMSSRYARLVKAHFSANRAMYELFLEKLDTTDKTKEIFLSTIELLEAVRAKKQPEKGSAAGSYAAAQMLVNTNYNYAMAAMPGLPADDEVRHTLISDFMIRALQI